MEKSTHTERVAVALAIRSACASACAALASDDRADGISRQEDRILVSTAIRVCNGVDIMDVVAQLGDDTTPNERAAFELAARAQHFSVQKNDAGDYTTPITARAYKVWQMAMQFKAGTPMEEIAPPAQEDASKVTVTIAGMPARMSVADAALLGVAAAVSSPAVADAMIAATKQAMSTGTGALLVSASVEGMAADVADVILPSSPPSLKLGEIGQRLGFTLTADFLLTLGFAHTKTDQPGKLYHEADFPRICAALRRHIEAVQAKF